MITSALVKAIRALVGPNVELLPQDLTALRSMSAWDFIELGLTPKQSQNLEAAFQIAEEVAKPTLDFSTRIVSPTDACNWCASHFAELANYGTQEEFWVVSLDTKNVPIKAHQVTKGTLRNSLVHPREVFRPCIADAANCCLVVHNHPSGDCTPSDADLSVTDRLEQAAAVIGIPVIDHIVVGRNGKTQSIQEWRSGNTWK
jgi:DNA repair protein RadC